MVAYSIHSFIHSRCPFFLYSEKTPLRRVTGKIVRFKPITPSLRHTVLIDRSELWKGGPIKQLTVPKKKSGGRGHGGKISVRHRGGGHKQKYRLVDFKRSIVDMPAIVQRLEYDPNRTGYIALIRYEDGSLSYILSPHGLKPGDVVQSSRQQEIDVQPGNAMPLSRIPVGTWIHNIELTPGKGGQMARSAGAACQLMDKSGKEGYGLVRLASKEQRYILLSCMATVGSMSNPLHRLRKLGKAGRARWMGRRPTVRGVAMNPVDHPHGGGEGRGKGRHSCSPTGILSKGGFKTRKKPKSKLVIVPRGGLKKGMSA